MRLRLTHDRYAKSGVHDEWASGEVREVDDSEARVLLSDFPDWFEVVEMPKPKRKPRVKRKG